MAAGARRSMSLGTRLVAVTTLLVGLVSAGVYVGLSHLQRRQMVTGKLESGRVVFSLFAQLIWSPLVFDDRKGLDEALSYLRKNEDVLFVRVMDQPVMGHAPKVLGEYRREAFTEDLPVLAMVGEQVAERRVELVQDIFDPNGALVGHAMLVLSLEKELAAFQVLQRQILIASVGIALALIGLLVGWSRKWVITPLSTLTLAAERLAQGEPVQLGSWANDEMGTLAGAFDRMAATIREREQALGTANVALTALSLTDPLTGLKNRRFLDAVIGPLTAEVSRMYARPPEPHAVPKIDIVFVMVDLDHFKSVNDTYGHAAGDLVLVQMRQLLTKACRKSDLLVRWGGEEFLIVARGTVREHGKYVAERVRWAVRSHPFDLGNGATIRKTCSVGYAAFPLLTSQPDAVSWQEVVQVADRCLYAAKQGGRDRSVGITSCPDLPAAGLSARITERFDELVASGALQVTSLDAENRASEPPPPGDLAQPRIAPT